MADFTAEEMRKLGDLMESAINGGTAQEQAHQRASEMASQGQQGSSLHEGEEQQGPDGEMYIFQSGTNIGHRTDGQDVWLTDGTEVWILTEFKWWHRVCNSPAAVQTFWDNRATQYDDEDPQRSRKVFHPNKLRDI